MPDPTYDRRTATLTYPTVHTNGTGKQGLLDQTLEMARAVRKAIDSLNQNGPHGRDYYVQDAGAIHGSSFQKARSEHVSRLDRLQSVYNELQDIAENISKQGR